MRIRNRLANLLRLQSQQAYAAVVVLLSVALVVATLATGGRSALAAPPSKTTTTKATTTTTTKATTTTAKATTTTAKATTTTTGGTTTTTGATTTTTGSSTSTTCPSSTTTTVKATTTTAKTGTTKKGATTTTAKATTTTAKATTTTAAGATTTTSSVNPCSTTTTTAPASVTLFPNAAPRTGTFTSLTVENCPLNSDVTVIIIKSRNQFEILYAGKATTSTFTIYSVEAPDNFTPGIYEVQLACGSKTASTFVTISKAPGPQLTKPGPYGPTAVLAVYPDPVQMGTPLAYVTGQECLANDTVVLYIVRNRKNYYSLATVTANSAGYFTFDNNMVNIPSNISPGNYVLTAKCVGGGAYIDYTLRVFA
jgi:hypothetical protein